jgi:20S proteasome alpha/beta subunit
MAGRISQPNYRMTRDTTSWPELRKAIVLVLQSSEGMFEALLPVKDRVRDRVARSRAPKRKRYPGTTHQYMTLCIAAMAHDGGTRKFVLCSDMLLGDDYQTIESEFKIDVGFSDTLASLYSGKWEDAMVLRRLLMKHANSEPLTLDNYQPLLLAGRDEFHKWLKRMKKKDSDAQCIIAGFIEGESVLVRVDASGVDSFPYWVTTGIGAYHAETVLAWRKMNQFSNLQRALYCAYEAKKFAELCKDVGKETLIEVISLTEAGGLRIEHGKYSLMKTLDQWFASYGPQAISHGLSLPADSFTVLG